MGGCRETANIWFYIKKGWFNKISKVIRSKYFWHDSFGKYFNRYIKCKITGHKNVSNISEDPRKVEMFCFDCDSYIDMDKLK